MKKISLTIFCVLVLGLIPALFSGCAKEEGLVVAEVGGDKIYAQDLDDIFDRNRLNFVSFEDEFNHRRMILDSLIIRQLLIQEAYKKHIDASEEVERIVLASYDRFLLDALYKKEIADKAQVTERDLKDFYDKLEYKVQASHILFANEDTANMIYDSVKNGANFEDMAVKYSTDRSASVNRGDLGWFVWGKMDPVFQEQAFSMKPGEISRPFKTRFGWHIVRLNDRAPNEERRSYDEMLEEMRGTLDAIKRNDALEAYTERLKKNFPIKVEKSTCDYILQRRANLYPPELLQTLPKNDFDIAQLDRDEKELVLASWDGGQVTLGQYLTQIRRLRGAPKPNFDQYDSLSSFIFQLNMMDLLAVQARRSGLEESPDFKKSIKKFRELTMADVMENDSMPRPAPPDEGELRQYYEDHPEEYKIAPKIHIYEIMFPTFHQAEQFKPKIKSLSRFKSTAAEYTERPGKRDAGGDLGYIEERSYPDLYRVADTTAVGDIAGPIATGGKYSLIYVADKRASEIRDFNSVKASIKSKLEAQRKRAIFAEWVEQKKKEVDIKVLENNLRASIDSAKYRSADSSRS
jgi:parvulin-like peptidyl-prolyl isomerase